MRSAVIAAALLITSCASPVYAWGNLGLPNPVTWAEHAVGGYVISAILDRYGKGEYGVAVATIVGIAKEISDVNFDPIDAIAWTAGAYLYTLGKEHPEWCWKDQTDEDYWYIEREVCHPVVTP